MLVFDLVCQIEYMLIAVILDKMQYFQTSII
jgi:hypothetical protein